MAKGGWSTGQPTKWLRVRCGPEQPHPPDGIAQSQPNRWQFLWIIPDRVQFHFVRYFGIPFGVFPHMAQHHPATSYRGIISFRHHVRTRPQDQMKIIRQDRKAEKINPERSREPLQVPLDLDLAMIKVLAGNRIGTQQKTAANHLFITCTIATSSRAKTSARAINNEGKEVGKFWQSRFRVVRLLDETALLACAAYVDLNPIRAKLTMTLETSDFTSVQRRIQSLNDAKERSRNNYQR